MKFTVHHINRKRSLPFIDLLCGEIETQYNDKLVQCVNDIKEVHCTFLYNAKKWSKEACVNFALYGKDKKSEKTDIKWSVFRAMVSRIITDNYSEQFEQNKIIVSIDADKPTQKKDEDKIMEEEEKKQSGAATLNVDPVKPRYSLSRLVLSPEIRSEIDELITLIRERDLIYSEWGFYDVDPVASSVVNFYGKPGTGKTMAAHAIVNELGLPLLPLNYSDIESKFVGDAPKNLVAAFEKAKERNAVLFFDEADSFLGKRITNVSSSSDQAINSLRSQMLMLLEKYDIITIFATNLKENYDKAFESRILKHIQFQLPDKNLRIQIIKKHIPAKAPFNIDDTGVKFWDTLGDLSDGLSPRELKNLVRTTFVKAATSDPKKITEQLFIEVFQKDKQKRDEIKKEMEERKKKLGLNIKENIEKKNFSVVNESQKKLSQEEKDDTTKKTE